MNPKSTLIILNTPDPISLDGVFKEASVDRPYTWAMVKVAMS